VAGKSHCYRFQNRNPPEKSAARIPEFRPRGPGKEWRHSALRRGIMIRIAPFLNQALPPIKPHYS